MERGTPEEGGIGPGVDAVVDAVEVLWVDGEGDATFLWLTLPADRKKTEQVTEADWASCPEMLDRYRIFL